MFTPLSWHCPCTFECTLLCGVKNSAERHDFIVLFAFLYCCVHEHSEWMLAPLFVVKHSVLFFDPLRSNQSVGFCCSLLQPAGEKLILCTPTEGEHKRSTGGWDLQPLLSVPLVTVEDEWDEPFLFWVLRLIGSNGNLCTIWQSFEVVRKGTWHWTFAASGR